MVRLGRHPAALREQPHVERLEWEADTCLRVLLAHDLAHHVGSLPQCLFGVEVPALANTYQLPIPTVQHVVARVTRPGGDPDAPRGHQRRKLDEVDEAKVCRTLDRNTFATNRDLAAVVGNKISERSVRVFI